MAYLSRNENKNKEQLTLLIHEHLDHSLKFILEEMERQKLTNPLLKTISSYAEKALLYEVSLTPKPGLVDRYSNGAHHDMDFYTFLDSIVSLAPFFINMQRLVIIIKEMLLYF